LLEGTTFDLAYSKALVGEVATRNAVYLGKRVRVDCSFLKVLDTGSEKGTSGNVRRASFPHNTYIFNPANLSIDLHLTLG
jgi:hypothetical protein